MERQQEEELNSKAICSPTNSCSMSSGSCDEIVVCTVSPWLENGGEKKTRLFNNV